MGNGYKLFVIRGLYIKAGKPMPFNDFLKSEQLKDMLKERKNANIKPSKKQTEQE